MKMIYSGITAANKLYFLLFLSCENSSNDGYKLIKEHLKIKLMYLSCFNQEHYIMLDKNNFEHHYLSLTITFYDIL
jgi:hypothetical protein